MRPSLLVSCLLLASTASLLGCRPRSTDDWAQPVGELDGPLMEVLRSVAEETGVPLSALVVLAREQTSFVEASEFTPIEGELVEAAAETVDEPRAAVWGLEHEQELSGSPIEGVSFTSPLDPDEVPARVGIFGLDGEQVAWAAARLGVGRGAIERDIRTNTLAAATLLTALVADSAREAPSADDWLDAMVLATGLQNTVMRAAARERMARALDEGFTMVTSDGEAILLVRPSRSRSTGSRSEAIVGGALDRGDPAVYYLEHGLNACTGTLIAPRVVLTARHCVIDEADRPVSPPEMRVVVGSGYDDGAGPIFDHVYGVARIELPPGPSPIILRSPEEEGGIDPMIPNDLALLVLTTVAREDPLPLNRSDPALLVGTDTFSVGFGERPDGEVGTKFRVGSHVEDLRDGYFIIGASTCRGDSGGPLLDASGSIHGVMSYGYGECGTGTGGYNEIARHLPWIDSVLASVSAACSPAPEICNGVDDDCDGQRDEGCDVPLTLTDRRHLIERRILPANLECGEPPTLRPNGRFTPDRTQAVSGIHFSPAGGRPRDVADRMHGCGRSSFHFVVGRDGSIVQLLETSDTAHPSGEVGGPEIAIGLEIDGGSLSAEGYLALADLTATLIRRHPDLDLASSIFLAEELTLDGALLQGLVIAYTEGRIPTLRSDRLTHVRTNETAPGQRVVVDARCEGSALNCATPGDPVCGVRLCAREPNGWERAEALGPARAFDVSGDPRLFDGLGTELDRVASGSAVYVDFGVAKSMVIDGALREVVHVLAGAVEAARPAHACPGVSRAPAMGAGWMLRDAIEDPEGRLHAMPTLALRPPTDTDYAAFAIRAVATRPYDGEEPAYFVPRRTCSDRGGVVGQSALDYLPVDGRIDLVSSVPGSGLGAHTVETVPTETTFHVALRIAPRTARLYRAGADTSFDALHFVYGFVSDGRTRRYGWLPLEVLGLEAAALADAPHETAGEVESLPLPEGVLAPPRVRVYFIDRNHQLVEVSRLRGGARYERVVIDPGPFVDLPVAAVGTSTRVVVAAVRDRDSATTIELPLALLASDRGAAWQALDASGADMDSAPYIALDSRERVTVVARGADEFVGGILTAVERAPGVFDVSALEPPDPVLAATAAWDHTGLHVFSVSQLGRVWHLDLSPDDAGSFSSGSWTYLAVSGATPALPFVFSGAIPDATDPTSTRAASLLGVVLRDETGAIAVQISHPDGGWFAGATRSRSLRSPFDSAVVPMRALFDVRRDAPGSVVRMVGHRTNGVLGWVDGRVRCDAGARCTWAAERSGAMPRSPGRTRAFAVADLGADGVELFADRRRAAGHYELVTTRPLLDLDEREDPRSLGRRIGGTGPIAGGL